MRLKGKILTIVIAPIIAFCVIIYIVSKIRISSVTKDIIQSNLHALALDVQDNISLSMGLENRYWVDDNGDMWNGDSLNLSQDTDFDKIKDEAGIDISIFFGDTRYVNTIKDSSGARVVGTKARTDVIERVLGKGEAMFVERIDILGNGSEYFGYYIPLYDDTQTAPVGIIFTGMEQHAVEGQINSILYVMLGAGVLIVVVFSLLGIVIVSQIVKKIHGSIKVIEEVSEGNLTVTVAETDLHAKDEVGDVLRSVHKLQTKLSSIVGDINLICEKVNDATNSLNEQAELSATHLSQIDIAVDEIAQGATTQAQETQETTENVIVMGDMIEKNNIQIENLNTITEDMNKTGENAIGTLKELEEINVNSKDAMEVIYNQTNTTNESAMKIQEAINLITDIAEETNLLSLNASIEAARAGEQGRGFAVVAGQIQKLAEQSNESARKIEEIVSSLLSDSDKAVATMNEVRKIMGEQSEKVDKTSEMFRQLKAGVDQSVTSVNVIADSTKEIDKTRVSVVDSAQSLTSIAQENAASTEQTSAAVSELSEIVQEISRDAKNLEEIAQKLHSEFQFFKV
ncbi:MAG: methyl-accepting chemotaxis protein [Lachnospiraceae bacterium]|jgi:methyl-accepting chemotaxis protein|nr:methyl-accepting chemotaxis protein [Lachnospiraceae bacterium]